MGRNFAAVAVAQFASQVLALVISVTLARLLGVSNYGVFVFGFAFPNWFLLLVDLGLDSVATIDVAADRTRASDYMTVTVLLRVPLLIVALFALWISLGFALADPFARLVTLIIGASSLLGQFAAIFPGIFRGFERLEYVALLSLIGQALTAAAVLALLLSGFGLLPVAVSYLAVSIVVTILSILLCYRKFAWFTRKVDTQLAKRILREAIPFGLADVTNTFLISGGPVLLTLLASPVQTGIFNAAFALTNALRTPLSLYYLAVLPAMARFYGHSQEKLGITVQKSQKLFFIIGLPAALGGWFYRDSIMTLFFGSSFQASGACFGLLVFTVAISSASLGVGAALSATGRQTVNLILSAVAVVLNLGLCLILIPSIGPDGAALAYLAASAVMGVAGVVCLHRLVLKLDIVEILAKPLVAGGAMLVALLLVQGLSLWVGIALGAFTYFATLLLLKGIRRDDWDLLRQITRGALFR